MRLSFKLVLVLISLVFISCTQTKLERAPIKKRITEKEVVFNTDSIVKEGYELYYLEKASWISTDMLIRKYEDIKKIKGYAGYVTYRDGDRILSTYWKESEGDTNLLVEYIFNSKSNINSVTVSDSVRGLNDYERILFKCYEFASRTITTGPIFAIPKGYNYNFVFLKDSANIRIIVLTGTNKTDTIPFGNDYEFLFDLSGKPLKMESVHPVMSNGKKPKPSLDPVKISNKKSDVCFHMHLYARPICITSTDICNFLLYGKSEYFSVFSKNYVSIFTPYQPDKLMISPNAIMKK